MAYSLIKDTDSASSFRWALRLEPEDDNLYYDYYQFLLRQAEKPKAKQDQAYNEAIYALDKAIQLNPYKTDYLTTKGWLEFRRENYEAANLLFKNALRIEPNNYRIYLAYSYILFREGLNSGDAAKKDRLLKKGLIYYKTASWLTRQVHLDSVVKNKKDYDALRELLIKEGIDVV